MENAEPDKDSDNNVETISTCPPEPEPSTDSSHSTANPEKKKSKSLFQEDLKKFLNEKRLLNLRNGPRLVNTIYDVYEQAIQAKNVVKKDTGIIYDEQFAQHKCVWDLKYPENPERYTAIYKRCIEMGLISRCVRLPTTEATMKNITEMHTNSSYMELQKLCQEADISQMEVVASQYDSIYFNKSTFDCAVLAAGSAISLVEAVCNGTVQNGMAIIRPPGHHAMKDEYCGYCYFNNVAVAAKNALNKGLARKILIVDFDVHHGQATQQMFYNDNRVLYFSIHRYEHGDFWPNLRESDYDHVGTHEGRGYNINFPLNVIDLGDSDYFHIISHILLPVAYEPDLLIFSAGYDACIGCPEFQPNLILFSAGFDSALGDEKGRMQVSPKFYGHLITLLSGLACGKLAVCLEGGYFLPSLAEGAAMTLKGLLGDAIPNLEPLKKPHETVADTIGNLIIVLSKYWKCFAKEYVKTHLNVPIKYVGVPLSPPYPTQQCYFQNTPEKTVGFFDIIAKHKKENEQLSTIQKVSCCYDPAMLKHDTARTVVECPQRLVATYNLYQEWGLDIRCTNLKPKPIDLDIIHRVHEKAYVHEILSQNFEQLIGSSMDMFYNDCTLKAIMTAVGCLLSVADSVLTGKTKSGVAIIRPPGHHAESDTSMGFCYCNNVAVTAQYIIDKYHINRVLIIDFDIHHGNGIQKIFYKDDKVLYLSIHKYDNGNFFPNTKEGDYTYCGEGKGEGYNVNVPLTKEKHYDVDYISIFHRVVLPIAYSYAPEVVLVSAGFDAGVNDYLGNYNLTPECFAHFIQLLKPLAQGRMILGLEGGYNPATVKYSMNMCIKALLEDPLPMLNLKIRKVNVSCDNIVEKVIQTQKKYWPGLFSPRPFLMKIKAAKKNAATNKKNTDTTEH